MSESSATYSERGFAQYESLLPKIKVAHEKASRGEDVAANLLELAGDLPGMVGRTLKLVAARDFRNFMLTALSGNTISEEDRIIMEMGPEIPQDVKITLCEGSIKFGTEYALVHFSLERLDPANKSIANKLAEAWERGRPLPDENGKTHLAGLTSEIIARAVAVSKIHPNPVIDASFPE